MRFDSAWGIRFFSLSHAREKMKNIFLCWQDTSLNEKFSYFSLKSVNFIYILYCFNKQWVDTNLSKTQKYKNWEKSCVAFHFPGKNNLDCKIQVKSKPTVINALNNWKSRYFFIVTQQISKRKYHSSWCLSRCHRFLFPMPPLVNIAFIFFEKYYYSQSVWKIP